MVKIVKRLLLWLTGALAALIAVYSLRYLFQGADAVDALAETDAFFNSLSGQMGSFWTEFAAHQKPLYHQHEFTLVGHIAGASIALLVGMVQFVPYIRDNMPLLHRASGYLYTFTAILGLGLGAYVSAALPMEGGPKAIVANIVGGCLGIACIVIAFFRIRQGQYEKHGQWMLRSYAILMAILTVYLLVTLFAAMGMDSMLGLTLAHMVCFPINLAIAEMIIRASPQSFRAGALPPQTGAKLGVAAI